MFCLFDIQIQENTKAIIFDCFGTLMEIREKQMPYKYLREELYKNKTESYQILPKTYLAKCGYKTREIYGQVANLTYISKETKDIVKRKAPADYREKLEEIIGRESITASLQENGLTEEIFTAGEKDVTKILADRRKQMALEIKEFYKTL